MGAGVAGLRAAVELAASAEVLVVTKESIAESNTHYAQGGIAVAMDGEADVALHLEDTVAAGDGLVNRAAAEVLVAEGPLRVEELIASGANFDHEGATLMRTREGAHSLPRILHANGDATGAEISRALAAAVRSNPRILVAEWTTVIRLLVQDGRVVGCELLGQDGVLSSVSSHAVLIASGGAGQVYSDTTNPAVATGDGIALAAEAGAALADMEFYQFHPTALSLPGAPRFLLSEALRGEGAILVNAAGERFMPRYHPLLELAPRDVVARAIAREAEAGPVYLDMRHVRGVDLHKRFPGISTTLAHYALDLHRDPIPVRPAAHYLMGGIRTDLAGHTSLRGLYAAGEAACTGVHGANRLASNSLLEGLVFGARAAKAMLADDAAVTQSRIAPPASPTLPLADEEELELLIAGLRAEMWRDAGLLRDGTGLDTARAFVTGYNARIGALATRHRPSRRLSEAHSLGIIAEAIVLSALAREESRGGHFRSDFSQRDDARCAAHTIFELNGTAEPGITFQQ